MNFRVLKRLSAAVAFVAGPFVWAAQSPLPETVDFNRDIRPILSDNCYACHGPDQNQRKADLRLDTRDGLFTKHKKSGQAPAVPGDVEHSELYRRLVSHDVDEKMPPPKSNKKLDERQISLVKKWIEQGAAWKGHWAYIRPERPAAPKVSDEKSARGEIDRFILARLEAAGLKPSPQADRATLIRRLSFDLIGLPPTPAEVEAFVNDAAPDAYEKLVERLLASPHFGERMAMQWLDLVRYADTIGYHSDNPMNVSPYRDYIIESFNQNKPFDLFTREQLAGDLLPNSTTRQKVASAYNRLLQTTEEGGAQPKEYTAKYAADRVRNASTVWLGATMGCAECHDHKFDPFTTRDFYNFEAFFADVQEASVGRREPGMAVPSEAQLAGIKRLEGEIVAAKAKLDASSPELDAAQADWEQQTARGVSHWQPMRPIEWNVAGESRLAPQDDGSLKSVYKVAAKESYTLTARLPIDRITAVKLEALPDADFPANGPGASPNGNFVLTNFEVSQNGQPIKLQNATADHSQEGFPVKNAIDGDKQSGWAILPQVGKPHEAIFELAKPISGDDHDVSLTFKLEFQSQYPQHNIARLRLSATGEANPSQSTPPTKIREVLAIASAERTAAQQEELARHFRSISPLLQPARDELAALEKQKQATLDAAPKTLVTMAGQPRTVRVLARGNWQDDSGVIVEPAPPKFLGEWNVSGRRGNRLDLADWLVSRDNPLTARVFVNRLWKQNFGAGLSKVLDDLGSQGEWPTHPELLDWLAVEFMESGWDIKHMVRLMVTSQTYRQGSKPTTAMKEQDPFNRLYARQSRFRLDAEMVRDNALSIAGLLDSKIGGPSVFPYQPKGYWYALNFPTREWENGKGADLYRRGLYTHWQRSFLHPSLLAFDAPSREEATCERARSNIPQQALVLLNDPTYVEASRVFAEHILNSGGASPDERLNWAFSHALSRKPSSEEVATLVNLLKKHQAEYAQDEKAAKELTAVGDRPTPKEIDPAELAAWTNVARVILNLHETITRS